jgi:hypothetical protein
MSLQITDQNLVQQIEAIAATEHRSAEEILIDALHLYLEQSKKVSGVAFLLSIAGQGNSGQSDVSERDEEILAQEVDPICGWRVKTHDENPD